MNKSKRPFAMILVMFMFVSFITPLLHEQIATNKTTTMDKPFKTSANELVVINTTFNNNKEYNDDDFRFVVKNGTEGNNWINGANISLYNSTGYKAYSLNTTADGSRNFYNVLPDTYTWIVRWDADLDGDYDTTKEGVLVSNGPNVFVTSEFGNLDWQNNDDDFHATILDIDGEPVNDTSVPTPPPTQAKLNFSIHFRDNNSIWAQTFIADGDVSYFNLPAENYTWKITIDSVVPNPYNNTVIASGDLLSNGTAVLVQTWIGPKLAGDPEYYDLEVFSYYEDSLYPVSNVLANLTYYNGTVIDEQYTPANGSVMFVDLPVAFVNLSVDYQGENLGKWSYNLTEQSKDARYPVILSGPTNQNPIYGEVNLTLEWEIFDEYPSEAEIQVDGVLNTTVEWINSTQTITWDFGYTEIGNYSVTFIARDLNGKETSDAIWVWIHETTFPVIGGPEDVEFTYTMTGFTLTWNVTDEFMNQYTLTRNGTLLQSGTLDPEFPLVSTSLDGLGIGTYVYRFTANDTSGNTSYDDVIVTVNRDDTIPVFLYEPASVFYAQGDSNIVRNWTVTDDYKVNYEIYVDGALVISNVWDSNTISFDFSGLSEGSHNVTLIVYDLGGNSAASTVEVLVGSAIVVTYAVLIGSFVGILIVIGIIVWYFKYR